MIDCVEDFYTKIDSNIVCDVTVNEGEMIKRSPKCRLTAEGAEFLQEFWIDSASFIIGLITERVTLNCRLTRRI